MVLIEEVAIAAIQGEALLARSLAQGWLAQTPHVAATPAPASQDPIVRAVAAGLVELFASRRAESAPDWTRSIGPVDQPVYLVRQSLTMPRLRTLCETESPEPLRRRRIFVPPNYLDAA